MLDETSWLSSVSKARALIKARKIKLNIGYADWILNNHTVENYFSRRYRTVKGTGYFEYVKASQKLEPFEESTFIKQQQESGQPYPSVTKVNAWYIPQENSINIPMSLFTPPIYHYNYPEAFKYGYIGAVIGHELFHAFDNHGKKMQDQNVSGTTHFL